MKMMQFDRNYLLVDVVHYEFGSGHYEAVADVHLLIPHTGTPVHVDVSGGTGSVSRNLMQQADTCTFRIQ